MVFLLRTKIWGGDEGRQFEKQMTNFSPDLPVRPSIYSVRRGESRDLVSAVRRFIYE